MKNRRLLGHRNLSVILSLTITLFPLPTFASDPTPPEFKSRTEGSNATLSGNYGEGESDPGTDQGTYQPPSGGGDPLPEGTPEPPSAINDFAFGYHCEHPVSYESGHLMFPTYVRCDDPPSSDTTPSTPLQPGRFCAVLPPPSTPTGPASTNNHPGCRTRIGSSPRSSRSLIQPKLTRSHCLAEKSRSRSQR